MSNDDSNQKDFDKIIDQALLKAKVQPPLLINEAILKKAKATLEEKEPNSATNVTPIKGKNNWFTPSSIAASLVIGFFMGALQEDVFKNKTENINLPNNKLVFQGDNSSSNVTESSLENAPKDIWLRKIAESALIGDIETTEQLIRAYKAKFPKDDP